MGSYANLSITSTVKCLCSCTSLSIFGLGSVYASSILSNANFSLAKVFDLTGRKILESNLKTIDLSELSNSIYFLRLYDNSNNVLGTSKLIKK